MSDETLIEQIADARARLAAEAPELADAAITNNPAEVAQWLEVAAKAVVARDYIGGAPDDQPARLHLWTNEQPWAPDPWFVSAMAYGPGSPEEVGYDWFTFIDEELGDLRVPNLFLTGTPAVQSWYAGDNHEHPATKALNEALLLSVCELVEKGLRLASGVTVLVSINRGDEPRLWQWDTPGGAARFIELT